MLEFAVLRLNGVPKFTEPTGLVCDFDHGANDHRIQDAHLRARLYFYRRGCFHDNYLRQREISVEYIHAHGRRQREILQLGDGGGAPTEESNTRPATGYPLCQTRTPGQFTPR